MSVKHTSKPETKLKQWYVNQEFEKKIDSQSKRNPKIFWSQVRRNFSEIWWQRKDKYSSETTC